jgi:hypothetical protein
MALTYLPAVIVNAMAEAAYPSSTFGPTASATNGTTTLTFTSTEASIIQVGFTCTGAGITGSATVTGVVASTGVVTISGTISTLTTSKYVFTAPLYVSLHTASPGTTGANEVTGGSYARQSETDGLPSSGVKTSTNAQNFTSMPAVTVGYFGKWSAASAGTYYGGGALSASLTVPAGATVAAAIGALATTVAG